ncbi:putative DNA-binding transcriptional regulator YafY [Aquimarina sp. EL_43]|uniref:HTH domain-containing protein n=1 Tax=unclassified Aquimarina TaxID=2627091 RepID=UPI0018C92A50|nr:MULTISPECIES: HTH domain-containing protein [unclassified Aquimarina]MBG6129395.1 putative DNA-binding transcriptional regulator YafY [Aquimarina sp. EL_35]MBG6150460.1 putative DNA-binding transcriptional regulator YafY [Aquimarina sp. EL_32]MBG6168232.1 putative DNA-binding transcriptional regulator YafY [Aquimarina sp. EL_43]
MDCMIKHIKIIERMDQLIRLQATGSPEKFAQRLGISRTKLYRMIKLMRALNAPIEYDTVIQSYVYTEAVGFNFGFYIRR